MSDRNKIINIAKLELGTRESNGGDDKYIKWYGGLVLTVSWCAIFVSWVFYMLNKNMYFPKFCDCDKGLAWFNDPKRRQFEKSKAQGGAYTPKKADIVFFSDGHTLKDSTHVGISLGVINGKLHVIEGNSADMVREKIYSLSDPYILGYGLPAYPEDPTNPFPKPTRTIFYDAENKKVVCRGDDVKYVQWELRAAGITEVVIDGVTKELKIDGSCGPITDAGIRVYQKNHNLNVDGRVGPDTRNSLIVTSLF